MTFGLPPAGHFSPDGTRIIGEIGNGKMFTIRPDGSHYTDIELQVGVPYFAFWPGWSPDGTRIIFCMFINRGEGIFTANPDGSGIVQVTFTMNLGANFANVFNGPDWGTRPIAP
jgi:WD40-like Beta Propeller Repeat